MRCLVTLVHLLYFFLDNTYVRHAQATLSSLAYIMEVQLMRRSSHFFICPYVEDSCFVYRLESTAYLMQHQVYHACRVCSSQGRTQTALTDRPRGHSDRLICL